ncbi:DUF2183 domain-containing protein [Belliella sp. DSM 111904]|uniref:DUF2183 domain-containing protein n=1 Tax=Belliella filtrata TaxID=2923435 RepID=A0ABS9V0M4_9BACT|nr:phosphatase domain-containing protein [Belliella filtrata]MCH7409957.1 DUF2183 domain-containing protein [Belliella filtrata]
MVKKRTLRILYRLKLIFSKAKLWFGIKTGMVKTIMIMPYKGFGSGKQVYIIGRVLKDRGIGLSEIGDSRWRNFSKMYKRFMSWEIPKVAVKASFENVTLTQYTDEEGYFEFHFEFENELSYNKPWQTVDIELISQVVPNQKKVSSKASVIVPTHEVEYGIISDIDDTIVPTGATKVWQMIKTTFFGNAHSRLPFPGVASFYKALERGTDGKENNPMFYVSSSPWNLYDFLSEWMEVHFVPRGPLMLRDVGLSREYFIAGSHHTHKLYQVEKILSTIPSIPFVLIGDSGQQDAEIYLQIVKDFPGRVKVVYIRHIDEGDEKKMYDIKAQMQLLGVEMLLIKDTLEAANDALQKGWIQEKDIRDVLMEKGTATQ